MSSFQFCNDVVLRGRVSGTPRRIELADGDVLVVVRVVVPRAQAGRVDTIDCVTSGARLRRSMERWEPGDLVEVRGALRRRFSRGGGAVVRSRYEVDVVRARRARSTRSR